jgi:diguanylate cyclase (GGDEF)-like protein
MGRPTALHVYVGLLVCTALPVLGGVLWRTPWEQALDRPLVLVVIGALVVLGELRPIMISHGDDSVDIVTISCCFSLALVLHGPLAVAIGVQALALVADDVRCRRSPMKMAFNHANFVLSLATCRLVYAWSADRSVLSADGAFAVGDLAPALLAAAVFYVVNQAFTTSVISLVTDGRMLPGLWRDLRDHASSMGVLLALAPVVVNAVAFSPFLVLLLLMPIAAVHQAARLAVERERQALHDSLTGLPNRLLFQERAVRAVAARGDSLLAVMLVDLDHFKEINDTLGHHVGDQLLIEVAARVRGAVREGDLVARLGGDEFAVLCRELPDAGAADDVAERIVRAMETSFTVEGVRLDVGASVGFALAPEHGEHAEALLQRADVALYSAKVRRGSWARYLPEEDSHSVQKLALLGELREGVARDELLVHYQPLCDARTGALLSVEALVRWQHPTQGLVFPDRFIAMAENTGLIAPITLVVLHRTLEQLVAWEAEGLRVDASVNLSARQLTDLELPGQVERALAACGLAPGRLVLEVTESHIVADAGRAAVVLGRLRELGVGLAVDDFGTGYSSLTQLRSLAVDVLKIDRSFVMHMAVDENDALIVRSTIDLAHNLGLRVVAEGVEDEDALDALRLLGCDAVQGYHLSRPLPGPALLEWARSWAACHAPTARALVGAPREETSW